MSTQKSSVIIGAGIGGLAAACLLAKAGWSVTVVEKNGQLGGRAGSFKAGGFSFDSGPSWMLMVDVFEHFFDLLGEDIHRHLKLQRLAPGYRVFYKASGQKVDIYSDAAKASDTFEALEAGAGGLLEQYLAKSEYEYNVAKERFMYKNYTSVRDFLTPRMLTEGRKLNVLSNMHREAGKYFKSPELQKILEFPALFLGSRPDKTPALFGILNHALLNQGVYYPMGGIYKIVEALENIANKHGVRFKLGTPVKKIAVEQGKATGVLTTGGQTLNADLVINNTGLHYAETQLLEPKYRTKPEKYWSKCTVAPSALLMYLGIKGKLPTLNHHNLLFSKNWQQNFDQIFTTVQGSTLYSGFPEDPSFYVCCSSKTDPSVAPEDHENLFVLVPVAPGIQYTQKDLDRLARTVLATMEKEMDIPDLRRRIVYKKLFGGKDFMERFNSYRGSALGLSHTLGQTAAFRPSNINKNVKNLYHVGADTNPGIGIPPTLISAELMYKRLVHDKSSGPLSPDKLL